MRTYYLLLGYLIPVYTSCGGEIHLNPDVPEHEKREYYETMTVSLPRNYALLKVRCLELKVVYYNVDEGRLLIKAPSRREAYSVANAIRGFLGNVEGLFPDDRSFTYYLQELTKIPQPSWSKEDVIKSLKANLTYPLDMFLEEELTKGYVVDRDTLINLVKFLPFVIRDTDLRESLDHLLESRFLVCGFMTSSYYTCHYRADRSAMSRGELEKLYLENRHRYETAFVAAFKGIERYFRVNQIKEDRVDRLFGNIKYDGVTVNSTYKRHFEIFTGLPENTSYGELISHFLRIRNAVAAHGNRQPPKDLIVSEDSILEIQEFLSELISKALISYTSKARATTSI
jgi:hypothetical protein